MSSWNFDLTNIPRGRTEERINAKGKPYHVFIMQTVWLASRDGKVYMTHWIPKDAKEPSVGSWAGWREGEEPIAWQLFIKPEYPSGVRSDAGLDIVHRHSEINVPVLEDVGGGP